ncbi:MAG: hypothetical protein J6Y63_04905 [Bacteroidales bacterium]|nr:hypothetical protein [Bacteroidales bacterium]
MTTSIDRKALDRAKGLIVTVGGAMRNASASLASATALEEFNARYDAALVEESFPDVSATLNDAFSYIAESWEDIRDNEVRLYEVFLFVREYRKFAETVDAFDDVVNSCGFAPDIFSDVTVGNEYYLLTSKYEQLLQPVLSAAEGRYGKTAEDKHDGIAHALHSYIHLANDLVLNDIIAGQCALERKLLWTGPLNEATIFGQYFGLSCKWMNDCFEFRGKDKRLRRLNYSHNRLNYDVKEYPIYNILVKYYPKE